MSHLRTMNDKPQNVPSITHTNTARSRSHDCDQDIEMKEMNRFNPESSGLSVHHFARHIGPQHQQTSTDITTSSLSHSVSADPKLSDEHLKRLRNNQIPGDISTDSNVAGKTHKQPAKNMNTASMEILKANVDDDDLDLSSLRDLMDSMRQAAKEIREITKPVVKTEKKEHAARSKEQKRHHKRKNGRRRSSGHHQQIQAEIHVISEGLGQSGSPSSSETSRSSAPVQTGEREGEEEPPSSPPSSPPTAFLHVENEELCNTWPRRRGRSVSRQRSMTENVPKPGTCSEGSSPMVLTPHCNIWLPPEQEAASGAGVKRQYHSAEKLAVHHPSAGCESTRSGITSSHSQVDLQVTTTTSGTPQRSRGRSPKHVPGRAHPAPPPCPSLSSHPPSSPPPHIFVSEHETIQQQPHEGQGQPADEEITIDMV